MAKYHVNAALTGLWREKWINLLSAFSISVGLFLIAVSAIFVFNVELITRRLPEKFTLTVYLDEGLATAQEQTVIRTIKREPEVSTARYISKESAMKELSSLLQDAEYILDGLEENPLPASVEVGLRKASVTGASVEKLAAKFGAIDGVQEVQYGRKLLNIIQSVRGNVEMLSGVLISVLGIAVIFVCYSTVKILFYRKQAEIDTLRLQGATRTFIKAPFLIEGGLIGLAGGLIAAAAVALISFVAYPKLVNDLPMLGALVVPPEAVAVLPAAGLVLGAVGAFIAIGRIRF